MGNEPLAIKVTHDIERFVHEMLVMRDLNSPYIVCIFAASQRCALVLYSLHLPALLTQVKYKWSYMHGREHWIAMEYMDRGNLRSLLDEKQHATGLPSALAHSLAKDIAQGLQYLHARNVMHRDLDPQNILLGTKGNSICAKIGGPYLAHLFSKNVIFMRTDQRAAPVSFKQIWDLHGRYLCMV